jgi:NTE family protein
VYKRQAGGLSTIFQVIPNLDLRVEAYGFVPVKEELPEPDFNIEQETFIENYYLQGMAALVYQTGIGPVSLSLNYYEKPNTQLYFLLSFGYIMFNKRGF